MDPLLEHGWLQFRTLLLPLDRKSLNSANTLYILASRVQICDLPRSMTKFKPNIFSFFVLLIALSTQMFDPAYFQVLRL